MSQSRTRVIGMEVHKDASAVASVAHEHGAEVASLGTMGTRPCASDPRLRTRPSNAKHLRFVSEAGPCGSWLSRSLQQKDDACWVVAPSLLPTKAGDRVTTDRRDAVPLARLARAGDLPPVSVPTVDDAALRARTRARAETISALQDATFRLKAFVLRQDSRAAGRAHGGPAHLRWRAAVVGPTPAPQRVFQAYVRTVTAPCARLGRLDQARRAQGTPWRVPPVVDALQAWRGGPGTGAVTLGADLGDVTRFAHPSALMKFLGCVPSAYSSGQRRHQGGMTNTGKPPVRRVLVEGAWASRFSRAGEPPGATAPRTPPQKYARHPLEGARPTV